MPGVIGLNIFPPAGPFKTNAALTLWPFRCTKALRLITLLTPVMVGLAAHGRGLPQGGDPAGGAYQMYMAKFKEMAAAYPQALIAQRTLVQASVDYVNAVENLWKAVVPLQGYLLMEGV